MPNVKEDLNDQFFMREALKQAQEAYRIGEVPVGAVLVYEEKIIARAYNQVESLHDASAHAELLCLREAAKILSNWRLLNTTLYCTLEPCAMCLGALLLFRVSKLVWGAKDNRHGANGSWVDLLSSHHPTHSIEVETGVLAEEAGQLMTQFFQERRCARTI